ncbi:acyltransferase [Arthrobacter sp. MYb227]|uniref:acyltransferase family protein n=1 Tax=Arthrobacter sp. MYb227 TaxID=1848601 RepID=UPI000CFCEA45|nr:acyltransferase [Arthrobacter sp. MYb227]PQZ96115.1 acyltransferase [Arthrobacter sp. MYb227]
MERAVRSAPQPPATVKAPAEKFKASPRLALLDGLRFFAAIMVLLYHYTAWHHGFWGTSTAQETWPTLSKVSMFGNLGVQLFFIISGFVIMLSAYGKSASRFIGSRISRLYPAYWVAVFATGILVIKIWPQMGDGRTFKDLLANLSMFHPAMGVRHIDGVYWTLWVEMKFYILILVLMLLGVMTKRAITILAVAWPLLGVADHLFNNGAQATLLMSQYSALFAGGIMLFMIYKFGHSALRWIILAMNVVIAAYFTGITASAEAEELTNYSVEPWTYWIIVGSLYALLALLTLTPLRRIQFKSLAIAGALTYPVYLLHQVWGWWLISKLTGVFGQLPGGKYLTLAIVIATVLGAAYLVHRFVERSMAKPLGTAVTRLIDGAVSKVGKKLSALLPLR